MYNYMYIRGAISNTLPYLSLLPKLVTRRSSKSFVVNVPPFLQYSTYPPHKTPPCQPLSCVIVRCYSIPLLVPPCLLALLIPFFFFLHPRRMASVIAFSFYIGVCVYNFIIDENIHNSPPPQIEQQCGYIYIYIYIP